MAVVICFHFTIFVVLETTIHFLNMLSAVLWFAFILLSLSYWKQPSWRATPTAWVVICFHFTIFVVLETTPLDTGNIWSMLWFAFILLSLSYWKQRQEVHGFSQESCDLLSFHYLCRTGNNWCCRGIYICNVVICFHFTIFVVLETTNDDDTHVWRALWFAFILLSLSYWKQLRHAGCQHRGRCDLLSFYYLCRTGNNGKHQRRAGIMLWFAFILLSLSYWKQLV